MSKRIFISTGEVSGDLQGALLVQALFKQAAQQGIALEIIALGGDRMAAAGAKLLGNTSEIGAMGILESLPFVLPTLKVQRLAKTYLRDHPPDGVVLIDYMGPNLALCEYLPDHFPQVPVVYYISPQEWVWGDQWPWGVKLFRSDRILRATAKILAIFPKEADYYRAKGGKVTWVGHPLVDRMQAAPDRASARHSLGIAPEAQVVTLFPASRQQEIKYLLPTMFETARRLQAQLPDLQFLIPIALEKYRAPIESAVARYGLNARLLTHTAQQPHSGLDAIAAADLAITKSGTVNLEIALLRVPQVVLYKMNPLTAWVVEHLLKFSVPYVSPPNIIEMRPIVPEFLQYHATPEALTAEALDLLTNAQRQAQMQDDYSRMIAAVGAPGVCDRAAQEILQLV
jgi:lipid-A-disaccharide synthase